MIQTTFRKYCDNPSFKCQGEMISTGVTYTSYPASYAHKCELCGYLSAYSKWYPHTLIEAQPHEKKEEWS